jgi:hypothetical protein
MPGLEYTLGLKTDDFDKGIKNANAESANFSKNLYTIGQTGEHTGRTVSNSFHELRESAHGAREGMEALSGSMELMGMSVAPEATLAVRTLYESIKALGSITELTGLSFGTLGVAGIGLAAAIATVVSGYEAIDAELKEIESEDALEKQYDTLKEKLIPALEKYIKLGRIDPKTGTGLINQLIDSNTPDRQRSALRGAQKEVGRVKREDAKFTIGQSLDQVLKVEGFGLLSDRDREKQEFMMGQDEKFKAALDLAHKAGRDEGPITKLFNSVTRAGLAKIDAKFDEQEKPEKQKFTGPLLQHTSLEKMGLVFSGFQGGGADHARQTEKNTARAANALEAISTHLRYNSASFGDLFIQHNNNSAI